MVENRPESNELRLIYDQLFDKGEYIQHRSDFENLKSGRIPVFFYRRNLLKYSEKVCQGRNLIEIGGGTGAFGVFARNRGWEYTNYDISETAIRFCKELSLKAHCFSIGTTPPLPSHSADTIVMWEVIEHVWNLKEYFQSVRNALRPGGLFLFSTPNFMTPTHQKTDSWGPLGSPPVHLNYFTQETIENALQTNDFKVIRVFKQRIVRPDWNIKSILKHLRFALFIDEPETLLGIASKG
jgi:2-polyprenyl-3-methyl-5-hydroxy-6-metoxy-1,4-benzoquinol methylase